MAFGVALLFVAIAAGHATHAWSKVMLVLLEVVVEGVVLVSFFGEVWFLAKTAMAVNLGAAPALIIAILVGLALLAPAAWLVWLLVANCYALVGHKAQFRSDFRGSLWLARSYTWRPRDFSQ